MNRLSEVKILQGVPFEKDTNTIITFDSADEQKLFFQAYAVANFTNLSFVKGFAFKKIRLSCEIEDVYNANYIMFKNNDGKWFYAYITGFEYISDNCIEVAFDMDYFQSYMGEIVFKQSPIERQHTTNDDFDDGNYKQNWFLYIRDTFEANNYVINERKDFAITNWKVCICFKPKTTFLNLDRGLQEWQTTQTGGKTLSAVDVIRARGDSDYQQDVATSGELSGAVPIATANKVFSGAWLLTFNLTNTSDLSTITSKLNIMVSKGYSIINVYMIPKDWNILTDGTYRHQTFKLGNVRSPYFNTGKSILGYVPMNNKCYMFPYCKLRVSNRQGITKEYEFERFYGKDTTTPATEIDFAIIEDLLGDYNVNAIPTGYKTKHPSYPTGNVPMSEAIKSDFDFGLGTTKGTGVVWNEDTFIKDALIMGLKGALTIGGGVLGGGIGASAGAIVGQAVETAGQITNRNFSQEDTSKHNDASQSMLLVEDLLGISFQQVLADTEDIMRIDTLFSQFGYYFDNNLFIPNILGRRRFNYVKTNGARIGGDIPVEARKYVIDKLNQGITFWHDHNNFEYGDFRSTGFVNDIVENDLTSEGKIF